MPKYIIERKVPGVGLSSQDQLQEMSKVSNDALKKLNGEVMWLESYVTDDATFCVYVAPNEDLIKKHAQMTGFPADRITRVDTVIDPSTGEMPIASRVASKEKMFDKNIRQ